MFTLRNVFLALAALLVGTVVWSNRAQFQPAFTPSRSVTAPIVFDNGSVRMPDVFVRASPTGIPFGSMRKCTGMRETLYTERECPQGYVETAVGASSRVTVLATTGKPAPVAVAESGPSRARKSLYEVLDMQPGTSLRERITEPAAGDAPSR